MTDCDSWFDLSLVNCNCHRILPDFSVLLRVFVIYRLKICATSPLCFLLSNCAPLHYVFYAILRLLYNYVIPLPLSFGVGQDACTV